MEICASVVESKYQIIVWVQVIDDAVLRLNFYLGAYVVVYHTWWDFCLDLHSFILLICSWLVTWRYHTVF